MSTSDQIPSLPVETGPTHVGTARNRTNEETNTDSSVNMETDKGLIHVETHWNDHSTSHVGTTADQPEMSHVSVELHVEMLNMVNLDTDSQVPVQKSPSAKQHCLPQVKLAQLILKPLNEL